MNFDPAAFLPLLIAVAGYFAAIVWSWQIHRSLRGWKHHTAIYDSRLRESNDLLSRHRFSYRDAAGRTRFFNDWSIAFGHFRVGEEVPIYLSPDDQHAKVARISYIYAQPVSVALAATALVLFAMIGRANG